MKQSLFRIVALFIFIVVFSSCKNSNSLLGYWYGDGTLICLDKGGICHWAQNDVKNINGPFDFKDYFYEVRFNGKSGSISIGETTEEVGNGIPLLQIETVGKDIRLYYYFSDSINEDLNEEEYEEEYQRRIDSYPFLEKVSSMDAKIIAQNTISSDENREEGKSNMKDTGISDSFRDSEASVTAEAPSDFNASDDEEKNLGTFDAHEWIDLGLSVKWATCNLGALSPDECGDYYAWGETTPKSSYKMENYRFRISGDSGLDVILSKYNTVSFYGNVDNKIRLEVSDDAARQNWGGTWRLPTHEEWLELLEECTWTWTTMNGMEGRNVTGPNGNSIFLPAAGNYGTSRWGVGYQGNYWSSSIDPHAPYQGRVMTLGEKVFRGYKSQESVCFRCEGLPIRPVME